MFCKASLLIQEVPVVFRRNVFSLCNVENDRSQIHVVTESVNKMEINVAYICSEKHQSCILWCYSRHQLVFLRRLDKNVFCTIISVQGVVLRGFCLNHFHKIFSKLFILLVPE